MIYIPIVFLLVGIIPWKVDVPQERLPFANWILIGAIITFFIWQKQQVNLYHTTIEDELSLIANNAFQFRTDIFKGLVLNGWNIRGLLGHMWLHAGKMHLIGNLFFLCLFGNSVCAKIGHIKFLLCYVLFGLAAGACQLLVSKNPSLGASGAINGVVGMYLVLYPTNNISCLLYVLPLGYFKTFEISGFAVVLFFLMIDIIFSVLGIGNTAYFAHFGGLAAGIITASLLLLTGLVKMKADEISIYKVFAPKPVPQIRRTLHERILMRDYANSDNMSDSQSPAEKLVSKESFIYIQCKCGMRYKISAEFAGKTGKCPRCNQRVKIPLSN